MVVCLPEEQQQIVQKIETRLSVCDKLEETITTALQQSGGLRQSILKKAFEGKLVAQNPEDEPVVKLLERIKAEICYNNYIPAGLKSVLHYLPKILKYFLKYAKRYGKCKTNCFGFETEAAI